MGYKRKILEARKVSKRRKTSVKSADYEAVARQCLGKVAYPTEKRVIFKIKQIAEEGRKNLRYYQCPFCEFFHISHKALDGQKFIS